MSLNIKQGGIVMVKDATIKKINDRISYLEWVISDLNNQDVIKAYKKEIEFLNTLKITHDADVKNWISYIKKGDMPMYEIINLTPHDINLLLEDDTITFKSKGVARVQQKESIDDYFDRIPLYKKEYGEVEGLPEEEEGIYYIVSFVVASILKGKRNDLLIVTKPERNKDGQTIGCYGFARI